jgi:hypothetical protein
MSPRMFPPHVPHRVSYQDFAPPPPPSPPVSYLSFYPKPVYLGPRCDDTCGITDAMSSLCDGVTVFYDEMNT